MAIITAAALLLPAAPGTPAQQPRWQLEASEKIDGCPGLFVFFETGSAAITPRMDTLLRDGLAWMGPMIEAGAWVELEAAIDDSRRERRDPALARRRAEAVRAWFARERIDPSYFRITDMGTMRPFVTGHGASDEDRKQNSYVRVGPVMTKKVFDSFYPAAGPIC